MTTRTKLLMTMAGVMTSLALSSSCAMAQFTGSEGEVVQVGTVHVFKYIFAGTIQAEVKCEKVAGIWKDEPGEALFTNMVWVGCVATHGTTKETLAVECKGLVLNQPTKEGVTTGKALGTVTENCTLKAAATCTITVEPTGNKALSLLALLKEAGPQVMIRASINGITAKSSAACQLVGISAKTTAAALESEFVQHGQGIE